MRNYSSSISVIIVDWGNRVNRYELDNFGRVNTAITPLPRHPRRKNSNPQLMVESSLDSVSPGLHVFPIPECTSDASPLEPGAFEMDFFSSSLDGSDNLV